MLVLCQLKFWKGILKYSLCINDVIDYFKTSCGPYMTHHNGYRYGHFNISINFMVGASRGSGDENRLFFNVYCIASAFCGFILISHLLLISLYACMFFARVYCRETYTLFNLSNAFDMMNVMKQGSGTTFKAWKVSIVIWFTKSTQGPLLQLLHGNYFEAPHYLVLWLII